MARSRPGPFWPSRSRVRTALRRCNQVGCRRTSPLQSRRSSSMAWCSPPLVPQTLRRGFTRWTERTERRCGKVAAPSVRRSRAGASGRALVTCSSARATARCTRSGSTWSAVRRVAVPAPTMARWPPARRSRPEQRQSIDAALPSRAPAKPKRPRRLLVVNLQMRNGAPGTGAFVRGACRPELRPRTDGKADRCL